MVESENQLEAAVCAPVPPNRTAGLNLPPLPKLWVSIVTEIPPVEAEFETIRELTAGTR